jgi:hypothetical protein
VASRYVWLQNLSSYNGLRGNDGSKDPVMDGRVGARRREGYPLTAIERVETGET